MIKQVSKKNPFRKDRIVKKGEIVPMERAARYVEPSEYIDVFHNKFIERMAGDIEELKLALATDSSPRMVAFLVDLCDPRYKVAKWTVSALARKNSISPLMLIDLWRKHQIARYLMTSFNALPKIAEDTAKDSESTQKPCPLCSGSGRIGKKQCPLCHGTMLVREPGDIASRKLLLESTGIIQQSKGTQVNVNVNTGSIESVLDELEALEKPPVIQEAEFEPVG